MCSFISFPDFACLMTDLFVTIFNLFSLYYRPILFKICVNGPVVALPSCMTDLK